MKTSTYFALLAEFGTATIPLELVAARFFKLSINEAKRAATAQALPVPTFKLAGQRSPWMIAASDLAELIDARQLQAKSEWDALRHRS